MPARFRFGYQLDEQDERSPVAVARRAEELGFDVVLVSDHVGPGIAPLVTLSAIAQATERLRLGTLVLNNDMRNPVQLAWEATTLDRLSQGRFELGLGAGHTTQEYLATGVRFDAPRQRKARLMETVEVIRRLVGGNDATLLGHAGAYGDIVGLQGLGRTRPDGHRHAAKWNPAWLTTQNDQLHPPCRICGCRGAVGARRYGVVVSRRLVDQPARR